MYIKSPNVVIMLYIQWYQFVHITYYYRDRPRRRTMGAIIIMGGVNNHIKAVILYPLKD